MSKEQKPKPLPQLQEEIDGGQAARLVEPPQHPGFFSMEFVVKKRLGFYWLRVTLDHPSSLQHTSTIAGFPFWDHLLDRLTERRIHDLSWELVGGVPDPLELPASLVEFLEQEAQEGGIRRVDLDALEPVRRRLQIHIEGGQAQEGEANESGYCPGPLAPPGYMVESAMPPLSGRSQAAIQGFYRLMPPLSGTAPQVGEVLRLVLYATVRPSKKIALLGGQERLATFADF